MKPKSKVGKEGFTLVELLASIAVLVAVGSVIAGIITASLRGTNKTNVIENIRENGNYALSQISRSIEYAQAFNGLSDNGTDYTVSCRFSTSPTPAPVETPYKFVKVTPSNSNSIEYSCAISTPATITSNGASMIDTSSIVLTDCVIACVQTRATDLPIVKVGFKLGPKKNPTGLAETSSPPILFETSITIRNYKK
ncbi:MAG: type II secretion system protein [Candidatus Levybacteria bacterium]|nr:type II secretion system protein [Candidatus Levybacteria bacterium]